MHFETLELRNSKHLSVTSILLDKTELPFGWIKKKTTNKNALFYQAVTRSPYSMQARQCLEKAKGKI